MSWFSDYYWKETSKNDVNENDSCDTFINQQDSTMIGPEYNDTAEEIQVRQRKKIEQQQKGEQQQKARDRRSQRYRYYKESVLNFIKNSAIYPKTWWFEKSIESRSENWIVIDSLYNVWFVYGKKAVFSLFITGIFFYWIRAILYEPRVTKVVIKEDDFSVTIENVYHPENLQPIYLSSGNKFESWLKSYQQNNTQFSSDTTFKYQYFTSPIYDPNRPSTEFIKNVTFMILEEDMKQACTLSDCLCITSTHLGIPVNIVFLNREEDDEKLLLINPEIKIKSEDTFSIQFNDDSWMTESPISIIVEYRKKNGAYDRNTFTTYEAACLIKSIKLNTMFGN